MDDEFSSTELGAVSNNCTVTVAPTVIDAGEDDSLNILVDEKASVIDWAWSRKGAAVVDVVFLLACLVAAGHAVEDVIRWCEEIPAWRLASVEVSTALAVEIWGDPALPGRYRFPVPVGQPRVGRFPSRAVARSEALILAPRMTRILSREVPSRV
ncbi:hypothetical protein [Amycolatopsis sp. NPDC050768]|uniref:hypothetical protein n=1 Tax=Amycolatopsis sp. NPDC050768 TaxID=3154839 RepID=UPI0033D5E08E